jgi:hypothetical protein
LTSLWGCYKFDRHLKLSFFIHHTEIVMHSALPLSKHPFSLSAGLSNSGWFVESSWDLLNGLEVDEKTTSARDGSPCNSPKAIRENPDGSPHQAAGAA